LFAAPPRRGNGFEQGRGRCLAERDRVSSFNEAAANLLRKEDGGYVVTFSDFGIGVTQAENREEVLAQAADLLETMVANYMAEGWDLPDPSPARDGRSCGWRRSSPPRPSYSGRCSARASTRRGWRVASALRRKASNGCSAFITRRGSTSWRRPSLRSGADWS
jgi:predicted RNase H-like HicB family nuclease